MKELSVIIPCNDPQEIVRTFLPDIVKRISDTSNVEVIFVDAFERAQTRDYVENLGCTYTSTNRASRAIQCNHGASVSHSEYLFFLHIDSILPLDFDLFIYNAFRQKFESGCFRLKFDIQNRFLSSFAWFTRFKWIVARGGDQGLFVSRECFDEIGKYDENKEIMEDIDICRKLLARKTFQILKAVIVTSARKYERVGILRLQWLFTVITAMYWLGFSNAAIIRFYNKYIG